MSRPRLLDLFCGAGGATIGYQRAGFEVVGVDNRPQPDYPGKFHQADAMEYLQQAEALHFDAIHASPPCQGYSRHVSSSSSQWAGTAGRDEPRLIAGVRTMLREAGRPYVIENVDSVLVWAEMNVNLYLCGTMFDLPIPRHRLFESSVVTRSRGTRVTEGSPRCTPRSADGTRGT